MNAFHGPLGVDIAAGVGLLETLVSAVAWVSLCMVSWQSVKCPSASFLPEALFSSTFPHHKAEMNVVADVAIWCLHREKQWESLACWWCTVSSFLCRNMVRAQMRQRDDALTALDGAHDATGKEGAIFPSSFVVACTHRQSN